MRYFTTILLTLLTFLATYSQVPDYINYQAVLRNDDGSVKANETVSVQIEIIQGDINNDPEYLEIHNTVSTSQGIISLKIGNGNSSQDFKSINWLRAPFYLSVTVNGTHLGTNQILSVPYSLQSRYADSTINEADPLFISSPSYNISKQDIISWNNKLDDFDEVDPVYSASISSYISADDTLTWNNKQDKLLAGEGIDITDNTIVNTEYSAKENYYTGQDTLGGIVFYIYKGSDGLIHGLIVSKTEGSASWKNSASYVGAERTWDGEYNTSLMTDSPAKEFIVSNFSSEWYLPSIDELVLLWENRFHVNKALYLSGNDLLQQTKYFSSTEGLASYAYVIDFAKGICELGHKEDIQYIRPIRSF